MSITDLFWQRGGDNTMSNMLFTGTYFRAYSLIGQTLRFIAQWKIGLLLYQDLCISKIVHAVLLLFEQLLIFKYIPYRGEKTQTPKPKN